MSSTDSQGPSTPSTPFSSIGRSLFGLRREQVHSVEVSHESGPDDEGLESFQKLVTDRFHELGGVSDDELLSIQWMLKLLDAFLCCQEEFRAILLNKKDQVSKPPLDRIISEFFESSVKALDICNASREGVEKIRVWQKQLEIVMSALDSKKRALSEGMFRRARKALMDLALAMLDDTGSAFSQRNRSFGRHNTNKDKHHQSGHYRSHSWSVSRSWSAAKQLQSISNSLAPPRVNDIAATNGLAIPVFTMYSVLLFVSWSLVAAIPCQDRGVNIHFSIPRQFSWSTPIISLHERILEESKKRDRRNSNGLLKEIYQMEKRTQHLTDLVDSVQFPLTEEQKSEVEQVTEELNLIYESFKGGLDPLECQVREVFRKIMACRTEGLEYLSISTYAE